MAPPESADPEPTLTGRRRLDRPGIDSVFFLVPVSAVIGPEAPIIPPESAPSHVDYEIELAAVIGRGGARIPEAQALSRVAGDTLANGIPLIGALLLMALAVIPGRLAFGLLR